MYWFRNRGSVSSSSSSSSLATRSTVSSSDPSSSSLVIRLTIVSPLQSLSVGRLSSSPSSSASSSVRRLITGGVHHRLTGVMSLVLLTSSQDEELSLLRLLNLRRSPLIATLVQQVHWDCPSHIFPQLTHLSCKCCEQYVCSESKQLSVHSMMYSFL